MYEKELQNLGLSEKESKVYLTALEMGAETAQNIAKKANINRATTYVQIDSLKLKGLMSEFEKGKKTFYVAESPERLSGLMNVFEKELDLKKSEVGRILPGLLELFAGMGERPKVRFFEGMEGTKSMDEDFLNMKGKNVMGILDLDKLFAFFPNHESGLTRQRIEKKIQSQIIYTRDEGQMPNASDPNKLRQAKFLPKDKLMIGSDVSIYDNKVSIVTYKAKPIGVVIENEDIANTMRTLFKLIWNSI
jgi:sugar-specific transcriptional regulator TrmB